MTANINLCKELSDGMVKLGFSEKAVQHFKTSKQYVIAYDDSPPVQRTMLIMYFYNLIMYKEEPIPNNIRVALNVATESLAWYEDMMTIVLPFILVNEETFYG